MLTSPGWYVAVCCVPTLLFDLCVVIAVFLPFRRLATIVSVTEPLGKISTIAMFGYGLWHFGIFTGLGILVISIPCIVLADRSIGTLLQRTIKRRVARNRQALIQSILDMLGVVKIGVMAEMVEELESYDNQTLKKIAAELKESDKPSPTLLASIIARHLDLTEHQADDNTSTLARSDLRELSKLRNWLLDEIGILDEDAETISSRLEAPKKSRRRRKAKAAAAKKRNPPRPEPSGDRP